MGMGNKGKGVYRKVGRGSLPESLGGGIYQKVVRGFGTQIGGGNVIMYNM